MIDLTEKSQLLEYLKRNGLWVKKGLGQNFLIDRGALDKIVEAAELKQDDIVIEVGPGVGTLTFELVKRAGEVVAVEMDEKLAKLLPEISKSQLQITNPPISHVCRQAGEAGKISNDKNLKIGNLGFDLTLETCLPVGKVRDLELKHKLRIINADILKLNMGEIIGGKKYKVVANIPYYITSKIIELFLTAENKPESIVLLVQKEVAERICAKQGAMSVLSVSVQLYGKPEIAGIVPKESFFPSPKVDSAILKISNIQDPFDSLSLAQDDTSSLSKSFFRTVHVGFASRRKTLANNLSAGYHIDKKTASDIIEAIGLSGNVRAQELSIEQWKELTEKLINAKMDR